MHAGPPALYNIVINTISAHKFCSQARPSLTFKALNDVPVFIAIVSIQDDYRAVERIDTPAEIDKRIGAFAANECKDWLSHQLIANDKKSRWISELKLPPALLARRKSMRSMLS